MRRNEELFYYVLKWDAFSRGNFNALFTKGAIQSRPVDHDDKSFEEASQFMQRSINGRLALLKARQRLTFPAGLIEKEFISNVDKTGHVQCLEYVIAHDREWQDFQATERTAFRVVADNVKNNKVAWSVGAAGAVATAAYFLS